MTSTTLRTFIQISFTTIALMSPQICRVFAQDTSTSPQVQTQSSEDSRRSSGALIRAVREATARFKDVHAAEAEGYTLTFGCVTGPDSGAMGLHYVNFQIVNAGVIDATRPQIILYEPTPDGHLRLTGADYLVVASQWDAKHNSPPELMGQLFQFFDAPNRFGLPPFYTLHVWAWKDNPNGAFVNWNPHVHCQSFSAPTN
jgi:hypothetical protein